MKANAVVLSASAIGSAQTKTPPQLNLESERWTLELTPHGAVRRLTHKPSGTVLLESEPDTPAYELAASGRLEGPGAALSGFAVVTAAKSGRLESDIPAQVRYEPVSSANGKGYRFTSEHGGKTVIWEVILAAGHGGIEFRIRLRNRGRDPVGAIRFPVLIAPSKLGETGHDDVILVPALDGGIIEDPGRQMEKAPNALSSYPGLASSQLVSYYGRNAGLYIATHDSDGNGKCLGAVRLPNGRFDLSVWHLQPEIASPELQIPYPVVVDTFVGDWWVAAEKYRSWSLRQRWSRERLATSRKVPAWIRNGALMAEYSPVQMDLNAQRQWFQQLQDWFHVPVVPNNRGWEKLGNFVGLDYLPPRPSPEEFRASAKLIRGMGGKGMIMLSTFRHSLVRRMPDGSTYDIQEQFQREAAPYARCGPDGKPLIQQGTPTSLGGAKYAQLCSATEYAKALNLKVARYCVEAGYPVIHFDQHNAGAYGWTVCYSRQHGHPPGGGRWIFQELEKFYRRFWSELAPLTEDFAFSMEQSNELLMPYLTMAQQRPFATGRQFPANAPVTQAVPLLMFLHHEHLFGWAAYYPWRTTLDGIYYSLAKGFSAGLMPAVARSQTVAWSHESPGTLERYLKLFQSCMEGYRGFARDALMYGRMMRPMDIEVPAVKFRFDATRQNGLSPSVTTGGLEQSFPAVLNSVWLTADGRTTIVLINHTFQDHEFTIGLDKAPGWSPRAGTKWIEPSEKRSLSGSKVTVTVPALSLRSIEFPNDHPLREQWLKET